MRRTIYGRFMAVLVISLLPSIVLAADQTGRLRAGEYNPDHNTVEMFKAIDNGDILVKVIPKDSKQCRVLITNKTDKPLNIALPETFTAMPLAQFGEDAGGGFGGGGDRPARRGGGRSSSRSSSGSSSQSTGGGMGGGMFNVAPEKVGNLKATTVCLEHGKGEPKAQIPYTIKPLDEFTKKPEVHVLCNLLGDGQLSQRSAQAAAWHYSDGMSWEELAAKQIKHANGTTEPYFDRSELTTAMNIAEEVERQVEEQKKESQENESSLESGKYTQAE
jgi:hypothetical protein